MGSKRWAKQVDSNQTEIIEALRKVNAYVKVLNEDLDLLVGYRKKTFLIEVKTPDCLISPDNKKAKSILINGRLFHLGKIRDTQIEFFGKWSGGPADIVTTPEEALRLIGAIK